MHVHVCSKNELSSALLAFLMYVYNVHHIVAFVLSTVGCPILSFTDVYWFVYLKDAFMYEDSTLLNTDVDTSNLYIYFYCNNYRPYEISNSLWYQANVQETLLSDRPLDLCMYRKWFYLGDNCIMILIQ